MPGENRVAALLDVARTVVRRAERHALVSQPTARSAVPYLNRLSDLLWTMARWQEGTSLPSREAHVISFDLARDVPDDVDLVVEGVAGGSRAPMTRPSRAAGFEGESGQDVLLPGRLLVGLGDSGRTDPTTEHCAGRPRAAARVPRRECDAHRHDAARRPRPSPRASRSARTSSRSTAPTPKPNQHPIA